MEHFEPEPGAHHLVLVGEGEQGREHSAEGQEQELKEEQPDRVLRVLQEGLLREVEPEQTCIAGQQKVSTKG